MNLELIRGIANTNNLIDRLIRNALSNDDVHIYIKNNLIRVQAEDYTLLINKYDGNIQTQIFYKNSNEYLSPFNPKIADNPRGYFVSTLGKIVNNALRR